MTHQEAIKKLESLHGILTEALSTLQYAPTLQYVPWGDGGDGDNQQTADMATLLMKAMWQGYLQAIEHAIEQLGRMEGLEK